jgi:hypothetical protein
LDPDSSPEPAAAQAARIATARNADPAAVQALIASQSNARLFGLYAEPLIKVLQPNLAQDAASLSEKTASAHQIGLGPAKGRHINTPASGSTPVTTPC